MPRLVLPEFTVVRDTREKLGKGWTFEADKEDHLPPKCLGTMEKKLDTGDYSALGYEDVLAIERKDSLAELWVNYGERKRFEEELERMSALRFKFIIVESIMTKESMLLTPPQMNRNVPGKALHDWMAFLMVKYNVPILFEGDASQKKAMYIMRHVVRIMRDRWVLR